MAIEVHVLNCRIITRATVHTIEFVRLALIEDSLKLADFAAVHFRRNHVLLQKRCDAIGHLAHGASSRTGLGLATERVCPVGMW